MRILFLTNIPSPYRVDFFNELGKLCDLTVLFEKSSSDERDKSWEKYRFENFKGVILRGKPVDVDSAICPEVTRYLKPGAYDHIILTNFLTPTGMIAITWMRMKKMEYWLESDGGFAKDGRGFKEKLKKLFIKGAKGYFSTADEHDRYYLQYGADEKKLYRYPFTSLKQEDVFPSPATAEEQQRLREKYGIHADRVLLGVGSFVSGKGFDVLLKAMSRLQERNVRLLLVGGVLTPEYQHIVETEKLTSVDFIGFSNKETVKEYMRLADVFILPTRGDIWGLVINEAMAAGLPVITTDKCLAGLALITSEKNGVIVPVDDITALETAMVTLLDSDNLNAIGMENIKLANSFTIEKMAQAHIDILSRSLKENITA